MDDEGGTGQLKIVVGTESGCDTGELCEKQHFQIGVSDITSGDEKQLVWLMRQGERMNEIGIFGDDGYQPRTSLSMPSYGTIGSVRVT